MSERPFPLFRRGELRDELLSYFRNGLRLLINPNTGVAYSEDEIAVATSELTNWYAEADAVDLVLMAKQARALWMADQVWPDRAADEWLFNRHGKMWDMTRLPPTGGSGNATGPVVPGSTFSGSTLLPDDAADYVTDPSGKRYQVLFTTVASSATLTLAFKAIDTGRETNIPAGTKLTWRRGPLDAQPFIVDERFKGGAPIETAAEFAKRLNARRQRRQGAGNRRMIRSIGLDVDSSVGGVFVYPCAYHAGSMHVAVLGKRGTETGPDAVLPSVGAVALVASALTPPGTRELPAQPFVVVTAARAQSTDVGLNVDLGSGWIDGAPWPVPTGAPIPAVGTVTDQTHFTITTDVEVASPQASAPALMAWDVASSRWERLKVASVSYVSDGVFNCVLTAPPNMLLAPGIAVSPASRRADAIARAVELYFDSLGPGELVSDERIARAARFPSPGLDAPYSFAASEAGAWIKESLGPAVGPLGISSLTAATVTPAIPTDTAAGPYKLTLGRLGIYPHP